MSGWSVLDRFLQIDPRDVGCAKAIKMLHIYVDLVAAGGPAQQRSPGIAAHLHGTPAAGAVAGGVEEPEHAGGVLAVLDPVGGLIEPVGEVGGGHDGGL